MRKKAVLLMLLTTLVLVIAPVPASAYQQEGAAGSWVASGGLWWYRYDDGAYPHADAAGTYEVTEISGARYAFDSAGWMATGWVLDGSTWLYANPSGGLMADGWLQLGGSWYLFNGDCRMLTGWQQVDGVWYYLSASGAMLTGWQQIGGVWYYLSASGAMLTGWQQIGGVWYYLDGSGAMLTGWQLIAGSWYYMDAAGAMRTGWFQVDGAWFLANGSGINLFGWQQAAGNWYYIDYSQGMLTGIFPVGENYFYADDSGRMLTGWQEYGQYWFYFDGSGVMLHDCWVGDYYLLSDGTMAVSQWVDNEQYYVGADGKWIPNFTSEDIDSDFIDDLFESMLASPYLSRAEIINQLASAYFSTTEEAAAYVDSKDVDWNVEALECAEQMFEDAPGFSAAFLRIALTDWYLFADGEAQYAVNTCGADWDEQARICADSFILSLGEDGVMSREILRSNLIEGYYFTEQEAQYGIDNCSANWNKLAVNCAKQILKYSAASYTGVQFDLISSYGFTEQEAQYAADNCGADWYEQALRELREYIELNPGYISPSNLRFILLEISPMEYRYTKDQAEYAIANLEDNWDAWAVAFAQATADDVLANGVGWISPNNLLDQLEGSGYTHEQAQAGLSGADIDWYAHAQLAARYLMASDGFVFSRQGLVDYLVNEGYDQQTAALAIDSHGFDWKAEALDYVNNGLYDGWTAESAVEHLVEELLFTQEEAEYAVRESGRF